MPTINFSSSQSQREKKTTPNLLTKPPPREQDTLTGAAGALWLNMESTEPPRKGEDYKDATTALPHAPQHQEG